MTIIMLVRLRIASLLHQACHIARVATLVKVDGWKRVEAEGILGHRIGNALGVEQESVPGDIVNGVADLVVVDIKSDTSDTAEESSLLLGLELLGTGEDTATGDTVLNESSVVRTAVESLRNGLVAISLVEVLEVFLNDIGTSGTDQTKGGSVAVVGRVDVVGAGDLFGC